MCKKHWLMMLICVIPVIIIIFYSGVKWSWLLILLCPLMHIFMMKDHMHNKKGNGKCH